VSIVRAPRPESGFVQIRNEVARDVRLSYKARGILVEILSRPDNWETSADALAATGPDGRTAVLSGLRELRETGYLITTRTRLPDGTFNTVSTVFDTPQGDGPESGFPTSENPPSIEHRSKNTISLSPNGEREPSEGQRVNSLTKVYTDLVPLSKFPAVAGVVRKAVRTSLWSDEEIEQALERLGVEGRSVTTDTLRYELTGFPGRETNRQRAFRAGVERTQRLAAAEQRSPWEIEA
jgi:hypothetical protein